MVKQVRARSDEAKAARRMEILQRAGELWTTTRYEALTLQQVAERVGLSKPALYAYFPTKEELFLSLTQEVLADWFAALQEHLTLGGRHTPTSLARLLAVLVQERPDLIRLLPLLSTLLERNVTAERARAYKHWLAGQVHTLGPLLEAALPGLPAGGGLRLLTYTQALTAGLYPMSDPTASMHEVLNDPELSMLRVEFMPALEDSLGALCAGLILGRN